MGKARHRVRHTPHGRLWQPDARQQPGGQIAEDREAPEAGLLCFVARSPVSTMVLEGHR